MKKQMIILMMATFALVMNAQTAREEIAQNPCFSASNYLAYPGPTKELTKAPTTVLYMAAPKRRWDA